jgi:preprotein translocase subunit SecY
VFSPWSIPEKKARKWMWIGLAAIATFQIYYVQEVIAAFVVLGAVFALISGAGFLVLLIDRASERGLGGALSVLRAIRHAGSLFGEGLRSARPSEAPSFPSKEGSSAVHV